MNNLSKRSMKNLFYIMLSTTILVCCSSGSKNNSHDDTSITSSLDSLGLVNNDSIVKAIISSPGYMSKLIVTAENGSADAQYILGMCYYNGWEVEFDYAQAAIWWKKAAIQNHAKAQINLGDCYQYGEGVKQDNDSAYYWYKKCAEQGNADGICSLGECYIKGIGVSCDEAKAVELFEKSAALGSPAGMGDLGQAYFHGMEVEKDLHKAISYLKKAVEQGQDVFQGLLGAAYFELKDYTKAINWLQKAAEQGDGVAQGILGECYYYGYGVEKNIETAKMWYDKAAEQENNQSQVQLGNYQEEQVDVVYDEEKPTMKPSKIRFTEVEGKCRINCRVNGKFMHLFLLPQSTDITISQQIATSMLEEGIIQRDDILSKDNYRNSNGTIKDGTIIKFQEIKLGDICLRFEKARVASAQSEDLLFGQGALEQLGTINNDNTAKTITLTYHEGF